MRESSRKVGLKTGPVNIKKAHEKMTGMRYCKVCNKKTSHLLGVGCMVCHNNSVVMREATRRRNFESWKDEVYAKKIASNLGEYLGCGIQIKFCNICGKEKYHLGKICLNCHPESIGVGLPNFITKDHVRYYKGKNLEELCKKLLSGEENVNNYPGFEIRFGRVTYQHMDVLTDEKILKIGDFQERDGVLCYYDHGINDYVLWEKFKKKFINENSNNIDLPDGFQFVSTFREQGADN